MAKPVPRSVPFDCPIRTRAMMAQIMPAIEGRQKAIPRTPRTKLQMARVLVRDVTSGGGAAYIETEGETRL
jgi:hypothetical protein